MNKFINFLSQYSFLTSFTKSALIGFSFFFVKQEFARHAYVYKEGDDSDWFYLLDKGSFTISKKMKISNQEPLVRARLGNMAAFNNTYSEVNILKIEHGAAFGITELFQKIPRLYNV